MVCEWYMVVRQMSSFMKVYCYVVVKDRMHETVVCCMDGVVERMY